MWICLLLVTWKKHSTGTVSMFAVQATVDAPVLASRFGKKKSTSSSILFLFVGFFLSLRIFFSLATTSVHLFFTSVDWEGT